MCAVPATFAEYPSRKDETRVTLMCARMPSCNSAPLSPQNNNLLGRLATARQEPEHSQSHDSLRACQALNRCYSLEMGAVSKINRFKSRTLRGTTPTGNAVCLSVSTAAAPTLSSPSPSATTSPKEWGTHTFQVYSVELYVCGVRSPRFVCQNFLVTAPRLQATLATPR